MREEKACGSVVVDNGYILLVKQKNGLIGFPKGHVNPKETEEETAIREVKEETGIDIEVDSNYRYKNSYTVNGNTLKEVIFFLGHKKSADFKPQEEEIDEIMWVPTDEAFELLTYDDSKGILRKLLLDLDQKK